MDGSMPTALAITIVFALLGAVLVTMLRYGRMR